VASAATFDAVLTVPKSMLVRRLGALAPERLTELCGALSAAVDC
jgi:mRNA-degrading endonuclease toxin of MazEF toxin-antitoxin module